MSRASRDLVVRLLGDTSKFAQSLRGAQNDMTRFGGRLTRTLTPAAAAVAAGMTAIGSSWNDARDAIVRGTGATGEALSEMMNVVKSVAGQVPQDFGTVGIAVADLNTRLGLTGDELDAVAVQALNFARVTNTDVGTAIRVTSRLMRDWGVDSSETGAVMDLMAQASQLTGVEISRLGETMVQFGAPLRQIGFTMEESTALLAGFEAQGVNTELVMGGLRQALGRMARAGEEPIETFRRVSEQIANAGSAGEANTLALELFGARAGPDMAAAIREGRFEIDELVDQLQAAPGTVDSAAEATLRLSDRMAMLRNRVIGALGPFGEIGGAAAGMVAAVGPLIFGLGQLLPMLAKVRVAVMALGTAMLKSPVGLLAAAVAGIAVAFGAFSSSTDDARERVNDIAAAMRNAANDADGLTDHINQLVIENSVWADTLDAAGVTTAELSAALLAGGDSAQAMTERLLEATKELDGPKFDQATFVQFLGQLSTDAITAAENNEVLGRVVSEAGDEADDAADAIDALTAAQEGGAESAEELAEALEDQKRRLQEAARAAEANRQAMDDMADAQRSSQDAVFAHRRAQQQFRDQIGNTTKALNDQSLSAEEQQIALDDLTVSAGRVADSAVEIARKQAEARGSTLAGSEATRLYNDSLVASAAQLDGPQRRAILDYIANINNIPEQRVSEIEALLDQGSVDEAARLLNDTSATRDAQFNAEVTERKRSLAERALEELRSDRTANMNPHVPDSIANAAADYLDSLTWKALGGRPARLIPQVPPASYNAANDILRELTRPRFVTVTPQPSAMPWWAAPRHVGGRVSQGQVIQPLSGETFVPDQPGRIMSREDTARMLDDQGGRSGGVTMNVTVNNPRSEDDVRRGVQRALVLAELAS